MTKQRKTYTIVFKVTDANGFCGQSRNPPMEDAIKKLCNQLP
jgi:hypothetical protein